MRFNTRTSIPLAAAFILAFAPFAEAKTMKFSGKLGAEGSAVSNATGQVSGTFNTKTDKVTYKITYSGLTGPVTVAHFHGPAGPGQDAAVMLPIPGPYKSGMTGTLTADAATAKALLAGQTYINLHTAKYPKGETRAQVQFSK